METSGEGPEHDRIAEAESKMERAETEDDPARLEAISQLHDILELELDRPEDEATPPQDEGSDHS